MIYFYKLKFPYTILCLLFVFQGYAQQVSYEDLQNIYEIDHTGKHFNIIYPLKIASKEVSHEFKAYKLQNHEGRLLLSNYSKVMPLETALNGRLEGKKEEEGAVGIAEENYAFKYPLVELKSGENILYLRIHNSRNGYEKHIFKTSLEPPSVKRIVKKINELGVSNKTGVKDGVPLIDMLAINDRSPEFITIVWVEEGKVYVNALNKELTWVLEEPSEIPVNYEGFFTTLDGVSSTAKVDHIEHIELVEMDSSYALGVIASSKVAYNTYRTFHVFKLNHHLGIEEELKIPGKCLLRDKKAIPPYRHKMKLLYQNHQLTVMFSYYENGEENLFFTQVYTKTFESVGLQPIKKITNRLLEMKEYDVIPVEEFQMLTFYLKTRSGINLFASGLYKQGSYNDPIKIKLHEDGEKLRDVAMIASNDTLYFHVLKNVEGKVVYEKYGLPLIEYFAATNFIKTENFQNNIEVLASESTAKAIDKKLKKLQSFERIYVDNETQKFSGIAWVDNEMNILKIKLSFTREKRGKVKDYTNELYYDEKGVLRLMAISGVQDGEKGEGKIYVDEDGIPFFMFAKRGDGKVYTKDHNIKDLHSQQDPYQAFVKPDMIE